MINRLATPLVLFGLAGLLSTVEFAPAVVQSAEQSPTAAKPAEAHDATEGTDAPAEEPVPEWLTWPEARAESLATGRPVLVFQHFAAAENRNACLPCKRLEVTLRDDKTLEALDKLGILVSDTAERWQGTDSPTAPAVALVPPGASETDKVKTLTGFRVSPPDAFMEDLKRWLNAND